MEAVCEAISCAVCQKPLGIQEGFVSSTGVAVCSEACKKVFMESLPDHGESQLTVYSRVTGYYTPVKAWNKGKQQEFKDRHKYGLMEALP